MASSSTVRNCFAIVGNQTSERVTNNDASNSAFCKAVILPMRTASTISSGTETHANCSVHRAKLRLHRAPTKAVTSSLADQGRPAGTPQIPQHCLVIQLERNHKLMRLDFIREVVSSTQQDVCAVPEGSERLFMVLRTRSCVQPMTTRPTPPTIGPAQLAAGLHSSTLAHTATHCGSKRLCWPLSWVESSSHGL